MPKPLLIDRWTLAFLDSKPRSPTEADRLARTLNRPTLRRAVIAAARGLLRTLPELRAVRIALNPLTPFGG